MGRTWQISGRICLPCIVAHCQVRPQVFKLEKTCQHLSAKRDQFETRPSWNNRRNFLTFSLSLWTDEATTTFRHFNVFAKTLYDRAIHKLVILCYFNLFTGTLYQGKYRHRFVILRAKCSLCSQALYFLYFSHPPETGKGGKRSYAKWSDYEEIMFSGIWPTLVLNVSKQRQLTPTSNY